MLAEVVRSSGRDAGPVVLFLDAEDSEAHPGIVASFFGVSEIPYTMKAHHPNPKGAGWWAQKPVSPAGSLLAGGRLRRAFRRTPPGAPCRAGVCRRPGALRHCPPVVGSAAINASLAVGTPGDASRPSAYIPGDARSVGSFRLSSGFRGISSPASGLRYSTVHLTAFHLRIPIRWNHMIRFQCVGIGGLGAKPSSEPYSALLFSQAVRRCAAGAGTAVPGAETLPSRPYSPSPPTGATRAVRPAGFRVPRGGALWARTGEQTRRVSFTRLSCLRNLKPLAKTTRGPQEDHKRTTRGPQKGRTRPRKDYRKTAQGHKKPQEDHKRTTKRPQNRRYPGQAALSPCLRRPAWREFGLDGLDGSRTAPGAAVPAPALCGRSRVLKRRATPCGSLGPAPSPRCIATTFRGLDGAQEPRSDAARYPRSLSCCEALQAPFLRFFVLGGWGRSPPVFALLQPGRQALCGLEPAQPCQAQRRFHQDRISPRFNAEPSALAQPPRGPCSAPLGACSSPERGSPQRASARVARTRIREGLKRISTPFSIGESVCVGTVFGMCRNGIRHVSERYCVCVTTVSAAGLG